MSISKRLQTEKKTEHKYEDFKNTSDENRPEACENRRQAKPHTNTRAASANTGGEVILGRIFSDPKIKIQR